MKITISDDEIYELKLPELVNNPEEFYQILKKLDNIAKIMKINLAMGTTFNKFKNEYQERETNIGIKKKKYYFNNPNSPRSNQNPYFDTKEKVLDVLQYAYHGNKDDKKRISKIMGFNWNDISKRFHNLFKRYDIKPNEIGLTNLPSQMFRYTNLRIPNYIIQSHTGIFDETENGKEN